MGMAKTGAVHGGEREGDGSRVGGGHGRIHILRWP